MTWKPSNEPMRYDRARAAQFDPIKAAIQSLGLPPIRVRKLNGIVNAIAMQIEDGGDSPEVNHLLLDALRASVIHQVGEEAAEPVLRAIEAFRQVEAERWEQVKAGTLPLPPLEDELDDLVE
jgi:hypothetical protein